MNAIRETMKEAGYKYGYKLGLREHVLIRLSDGREEIWSVNKGHASYGIRWRNTDLEFARGLNEFGN